MPYIFILIFVLITFIFPSLEIFGQDAQAKTQNLITALAKTKYKKKEKKGFTTESFRDVKHEAVIKKDIREYAGVYKSPDADFQLTLRISADGKIEGDGYDSFSGSTPKQSFTLQNARIEGALLTAVKVYAAGGAKSENFEAVFNNRTTVEGKNPNEISSRETKYGLGFVYPSQFASIDVVTRIFLEFKPYRETMRR